jgi:hypothetical protein
MTLGDVPPTNIPTNQLEATRPNVEDPAFPEAGLGAPTATPFGRVTGFHTADHPDVGPPARFSQVSFTPDTTSGAPRAVAAGQDFIDTDTLGGPARPDASRDQVNATSDDAPENQDLVARDPNDQLKLKFRVGHQDGDPPADYRMDADGNLIPLHDESKKHNGATNLIVEMDDSAGQKVDNINYIRRMEAQQAYQALSERYHLAGMEAPPEIIPPDVPRPAPTVRAAGNNNYGPVDSSGGNQGGNGSFFTPPPQSDGKPASVASTTRNFDPGKVDWQHLSVQGLDKNKPVDQIIATIMDSNHEGAKPSTVNYDAGNHKVDMGLYQANQNGELGLLLHAITALSPDVAKKALGDKLYTMAANNPSAIVNMSSSELLQTLQTAVKNPEFAALNEKAQLGMMRKKIEHATEVASSHGIKSIKGVALVADFINQYGEGGAERYLKAANRVSGEVDKLVAINNVSPGDWGRHRRNESIIRDDKLSAEQTMNT